MEINIIRQQYRAVVAAVGDVPNRITATASTTGNADRYGRVIFPGAFKSACKSFVSDGFVAIGHDWDGLPIAFPISAAEQGNELVCTAEFHSTQEAQDARTVCMERMSANKTVPVSVGFLPDDEGYQYFETGGKLLDFASANGYDTKLFDAKAINGLGWCMGIFNVAALLEWSIVCVPANTKARGTAVASLTALATGDLDAPFADHLESVLAAVSGIANRAGDWAALRTADDKPLNRDRVSQLAMIRDRLDEIVAAAKPTTSTASDSAPNGDMERAFRMLELQMNGLRTGTR